VTPTNSFNPEKINIASNFFSEEVRPPTVIIANSLQERQGPGRSGAVPTRGLE